MYGIRSRLPDEYAPLFEAAGKCLPDQIGIEKKVKEDGAVSCQELDDLPDSVKRNLPKHAQEI